MHLDPESEPGMGGEINGDEDTDFQVSADERPDFNGGSDTPDVSNVAAAAAAPARPADPNQRVSHSAAPAAAPAQEWTSIRDAAQQAGFDFGHGVQDDDAAFQLLLQRAQASKQQSMYEQLGR